uniref:Glycerol-3-phosphate acyltransferase, chloroplastic n=1 Tax=Aegilops tauschii TaxID=37682 RepID=R7W5C7_AEGTA
MATAAAKKKAADDAKATAAAALAWPTRGLIEKVLIFPTIVYKSCMWCAEFVLRVRKEVERGKLRPDVADNFENLYYNYKNAVNILPVSCLVLQNGDPNAYQIMLSNMMDLFDRVLLDEENPFTFQPYHKAIREPFDYYTFGQNYIRPLVDFRNSYVGNISVFSDMENQLRQGHNVVLMSNHQTEADPAVIALSLERSNPWISENIVYVAGDRVLTDPLCKPFSMGSGGSHIIWIAPSGGRDRPDPLTGEWHPAPFDASAVDNMRRLLEHSGVPGHIYPLSLLCYEIMPPPQQIEKEIGEQRVISFHGVGLSVAEEIKYGDVTAQSRNADEGIVAEPLNNVQARGIFSEALYNSVVDQYNVLKSAIFRDRGAVSSNPAISLSQPWR